MSPQKLACSRVTLVWSSMVGIGSETASVLAEMMKV